MGYHWESRAIVAEVARWALEAGLVLEGDPVERRDEMVWVYFCRAEPLGYLHVLAISDEAAKVRQGTIMKDLEGLWLPGIMIAQSPTRATYNRFGEVSVEQGLTEVPAHLYRGRTFSARRGPAPHTGGEYVWQYFLDDQDIGRGVARWDDTEASRRADMERAADEWLRMATSS